MARQFSKNLANYMSLGTGTLGAILNGKAVLSIHAWVHPFSFTGGGQNDNLVFSVVRDGLNTGLTLGIDDSTGVKSVRVSSRSTSESRQGRTGLNPISLNTPSPIGGVVNYPADTITPYLNGTADNGGSVSFGNAAYTQGTPSIPDMVGGFNSPPTNTAAQWDGYLAELAIWGVDIGATAFADLAAGKSPWVAHRTDLLFYLPIFGRFTTEPDLVAGLVGTITGSLPVAAHPSATTGVYDLRDDHTVNIGSAPPTVPTVPARGSSILLADHRTRIWRVTDGTTANEGNKSFRTHSASSSTCWSKDTTHFVVVGTQGTCYVFSFNGSNPLAPVATYLRIASGMQPEVSFSGQDNNIIVGRHGSDLTKFVNYSVSGDSRTDIFDIQTIDAAATAVRAGHQISYDTRERIVCTWGGGQQDQDMKVAWFERTTPANRRWVNTQTSLLDGTTPTNITLGFLVHAVTIDRTGNFVTIYSTDADIQAGKAPAYLWNLATNTFTAITRNSPMFEGGHTCDGFMIRSNSAQGPGSYDGRQWIMRPMVNPGNLFEVINPLITPQVDYAADHVSWHNCTRYAQAPLCSGLYYHTQWPQNGSTDNPWSPLMDEIVLFHPSGPLKIQRVCFHFSDTRPDDGTGNYGFWASPHPQISFDGNWILFSSNWGKTLGDDPVEGDPDVAQQRQDVFLVYTGREAVSGPEGHPIWKRAHAVSHLGRAQRFGVKTS